QAVAGNQLLLELRHPAPPGGVLRLHFLRGGGLCRPAGRGEAKEAHELGRGHWVAPVSIPAGRWALDSEDARASPDWTRLIGHGQPIIAPCEPGISRSRPGGTQREGGGSMSRYVGAIDQGTTSTRFIVFDSKGDIVSLAQKEHRQIYPRPGWVEHDPLEIIRNTDEVINTALTSAKLRAADLAAIGITNQRETTVVWDRATGQPLCNAVVWMDTRTAPLVASLAREGGQDRFRAKTGLPLTTYFAGLKLRWILDHVADARRKAEAGEALFGTIDSWLTWNLTGGPKGGAHIIDVTNASRTQLMSIATCEWDEAMLGEFRIPRTCLPRIVSSSEAYGEIGT